MDRKIEVTLFDKESPRSFWQILPEALVRQIENLTNGPDSYLLSLEDAEILKESSRRGKSFGEMDYAIRNRFWVEYARFLEEVDHRGKMSMPFVLGRSVAKEIFYKHIATDPLRLAFILRKPARYDEQVSTLLHKANERLREILDIPYKNPDGSINMQIVNKFLQIQESLKKEEMRLIYKKPKARGESEPVETEVPIPETKAPETTAERLARIKLEKAQNEVLPGQVI